MSRPQPRCSYMALASTPQSESLGAQPRGLRCLSTPESMSKYTPSSLPRSASNSSQNLDSVTRSSGSMGGTSSATNRLKRSAFSEGKLIPLTITGRLTLKAYSLSVVYSSRLESPEPVTRDESRSAKPFGNPDRISKTTMPRRRASRFLYYGPFISAVVSRAVAYPRLPLPCRSHQAQGTGYVRLRHRRTPAGRTRARSSSGGGRSLPARLVPRDPLAPLFVLAAPEGVYPSAVGMPISPPLLRAACPAKMLRNAEISKNLRVTPLCVRSQKPHRGPATRKPLPRNAEG